MMQAGAYVASVVLVEQGHTRIHDICFICALRRIVNQALLRGDQQTRLSVWY